MPQLDESDWNPGEGRSREPIVIEGEAIDRTPSTRDDTFAEPPFPKDESRDREPTLESESLFGLIPYGPVRALKVEHLHSKAQLLEQLARTIPRNEYDLPEFVYRADMLDHTWVQEQLVKLRGVRTPEAGSSTAATSILSPAQGAGPNAGDIQAHLDNAIVRLEYLEGFPVTPNGVPLWNQLDWEPQSDYEMFIQYLELGAERAIHKLIAWDITDVKAAFHINYWNERVRSFDLYRIANATKLRLHRMLDTEDSHYKTAEKLLDKVTGVLDKFDVEEIKEVGFEKLIKVFGDLGKIQRISAGLPANGPMAEGEGVKAPTTNIIMQQIAQSTPQKAEESDDNMDLLQDSPETLELAQQFIIRSQKARTVNE